MKLTKKAINKLDRKRRLQIAIALNFSEQWINKVVAANKENGPLTTLKAIEIIRQETGLTDSDILIDTPVVVAK